MPQAWVGVRVGEYNAALVEGLGLKWRHELLSPSGELLASTVDGDAPIHWGAELQPLTFSNDRFSARSVMLSVPDPDGSLVPAGPGSLLHPDTGNRVRISAGLADSSWWPQAVMIPNEVDVTWHQGVITIQVYLVDVLQPLRAEMTVPFRFADGENVQSVIARMVRSVIPDAVGFAATPFSMPSGSIEAGSELHRHVVEILDGVGHEIMANHLGEVYSRPIAAANDSGGPRWRYGQDDGLPMENVRRVISTDVPQGWRVEGGSFQNQEEPVTTTVYDTDPASEGFYRGEVNAQIRTSRLPWVRTTRQAAVAAYGQLRRHGTGPMTIMFDTVPNPAIIDRVMLEVERPEINASGLYRVLGYSLPLHVDGKMQIKARKVWNPEVGYRPRGDANSCVPSFSDGFARADEDLLSDDWVELGWSWGVVGQRAIQRYPNGWSMALHTAPLCSFSQSAAITIAALPSGRFLGPVVSSSGEFDGYVAMGDSNGVVRVERWHGGRKAATIGEYSSGATLVGRTLAIEATAGQLEVKLDGGSVGTWAVDDLSGSTVGMLAYGGPVGVAPSVSAFNGAAV